MIGAYESESERDECVGPIGHHDQRGGGGMLSTTTQDTQNR